MKEGMILAVALCYQGKVPQGYRLVSWPVGYLSLSLFVLNTGETAGFPQQQYQTPTLSWTILLTISADGPPLNCDDTITISFEREHEAKEKDKPRKPKKELVGSKKKPKEAEELGHHTTQRQRLIGSELSSFPTKLW